MIAREVLIAALRDMGGQISWTHDEVADAILSALSAAGLAVVPVEPTEAEWERVMAACGTVEGSLWEMRARSMYPEIVRAMLAAAEARDDG